MTIRSIIAIAATAGLGFSAPIAAEASSPAIAHSANYYGITAAKADAIHRLAHRLGVDPYDLMAVIAFETGGTFDPQVRNPLSGAVGLIQFTGPAAEMLGTTRGELGRMSFDQQLVYVGRYFEAWGVRKLQNPTLGDLYTAVLAPARLTGPRNRPLYVRGRDGAMYSQNAGLDRNRDGAISRDEAASLVRQRWMSKSERLDEGGVAIDVVETFLIAVDGVTRMGDVPVEFVGGEAMMPAEVFASLGVDAEAPYVTLEGRGMIAVERMSGPTVTVSRAAGTIIIDTGAETVATLEDLPVAEPMPEPVVEEAPIVPAFLAEYDYDSASFTSLASAKAQLPGGFSVYGMGGGSFALE